MIASRLASSLDPDMVKQAFPFCHQLGRKRAMAQAAVPVRGRGRVDKARHRGLEGTAKFRFGCGTASEKGGRCQTYSFRRATRSL
jgi:hypothetical protein